MLTLRAKLVLIVLLAVAPSFGFILYQALFGAREAMQAQTYLGLAAAGLGLAFALTIAWRLGERLLLRPLSRLAAHPAESSAGPPPRGDELGRIRRTLDEMAATVAQQRAVVAMSELIESQNDLLQAVSDAQSTFIAGTDAQAAFRRLIDHVVRLTESEYGMVGEIRKTEQGRPYLHVLALSTGLSWDAPWRRPGERPGTLEFHNPNTLLGAVFAAGKIIISNDPAGDARAGGLPQGHLRLHAFMGLPLHRGEQPVGIMALANRAEGYDEGLIEGLRPLIDTAATLIGAYRDEKRRREAEARLRRLNSELDERVRSRTADLQASLQELESFSYSISHDLRTPLRGINGFAAILSDEYGPRLDEEGRHHLKRIGAAAVHMGNLIDQLTELARITRAPVRASDTDLSAMARGLMHELRQSAPEHDAEFVLADAMVARCDARLMRVALGNLLGNAWKYTKGVSAARIEFGRREQDDEVIYYVRDNGIGFDMAFADKLFKPFQPLHASSDPQGHHAGIGLATVRRIVLRHGGRVWAEGEPGKGATFYFTLP